MMRTEAKRAIYAGSFDPPTYGHLWIIEEAKKLFDEVVIALGLNPDKHYTYSVEERLSMLQSIVGHSSQVNISSFKNIYLVEYAHQIGAQYIIRGIRSVADYEYERSMRYINSDMYPDIGTWFLFPPREYSEVSSTLVKGLVGFENWEEVLKKYVPDAVRKMMVKKFKLRR
ncbi:MAG: pantetheine-phosphate adenylyltransferase [Neisseriaceae bacterium]